VRILPGSLETKGRGTSLREGSLCLSFHQQWSKLGTLLRTDTSDVEMKKKFKISDRAPGYRT
jgi:hypothetical protein